MDVEQLQESGRVIFRCIAGSHAYGTSTPSSDVDVRGFFVNPSEDYLGLFEPAGQIGDEKHDITYYSLKRGFELLMKANPNMLELLWMPEDCVKVQTPQMNLLIANRELFISTKCFYTFSGYAHAQIAKAKGQNKKVHNPQPERQPCKEDFCWVVTNWKGNRRTDYKFPCRPMPLQATPIDLSQYHASKVEHSDNVYRLYFYGRASKGVFRGDQMLVPESIPEDDEFVRFSGLLVFNQRAFDMALKEWNSYWDWKKNRNEARWVDQESGKLNYDAKNMMHCMRLLMSGENILENGSPLVRFSGVDLDYLMEIRGSKLPYEDLMAEVDKRMAGLQKLKDNSSLPDRVNQKKLNELYKELINYV